MNRERLFETAAALVAVGTLTACGALDEPKPPVTTYPNPTEAPKPQDTVGLGSLPVTVPETTLAVSDEAFLSDATCDSLLVLSDALGSPGEGPLRIGTGNQTSYVEVLVDPNRVSLSAEAVMNELAEGTNTIPVPSDAEGAAAVHNAVGAVSTAELTVGPIDDVYRVVFENGVENAGSAFDEANTIAMGMLDQARAATDEAMQVGC